MRSQEISDKWTKPSAPLILTKAPNSARLVTLPVRTSPSVSSLKIRSLIDSRVSELAARSDKINLRRSRSTSITHTSISSPTIGLQRFSGVSPVKPALRERLICDAGTKPFRPSTGTIKPPLLYPRIVLL